MDEKWEDSEKRLTEVLKILQAKCVVGLIRGRDVDPDITKMVVEVQETIQQYKKMSRHLKDKNGPKKEYVKSCISYCNNLANSGKIIMDEAIEKLKCSTNLCTPKGTEALKVFDDLKEATNEFQQHMLSEARRNDDPYTPYLFRDESIKELQEPSCNGFMVMENSIGQYKGVTLGDFEYTLGQCIARMAREIYEATGKGSAAPKGCPYKLIMDRISNKAQFQSVVGCDFSLRDVTNITSVMLDSYKEFVLQTDADLEGEDENQIQASRLATLLERDFMKKSARGGDYTVTDIDADPDDVTTESADEGDSNNNSTASASESDNNAVSPTSTVAEDDSNGFSTKNVATESDGNEVSSKNVAAESDGNEVSTKSVAAEGDNNDVPTKSVAAEGDNNDVPTKSVSAEGDNNDVPTKSVAAEGNGNVMFPKSVAAEGDNNGVSTERVAAEGDDNGVSTERVAAEGDVNGVSTERLAAEGDDNDVSTERLAAEDDNGVSTKSVAAENEDNGVSTKSVAPEGEDNGVYTKSIAAKGDGKGVLKRISDNDGKGVSTERVTDYSSSKSP